MPKELKILKGELLLAYLDDIPKFNTIEAEVLVNKQGKNLLLSPSLNFFSSFSLCEKNLEINTILGEYNRRIF